MNKKSIKLTLTSLIMVMLIILSACSSGTSGDGSDANTLEFKFGHTNSPDHVQDSLVLRPFSKEVSEVTDGRVAIKIYPGGALAGSKDTLDNITTGIMDGGWGVTGYNPGKFPAHSVLQLPFLSDGTGAELSIVAQKLYDQFPEIQEEYKDVKPLWVHASDSYAIVTKGKQVKTFEDVNGLKLRSPSTEATEMIKSWGATPVSVPAPEIYDAMQKGIIDGGVLPVAALKDFNLFDVVDYVTIGNFNTTVFYTLMNKDSWEKISEEDKKVIEEKFLGEPMAEQAGAAFDQQREAAVKQAEEQGIEFYTLPDKELETFKDKSNVVVEKWLADMESKGIDGQKIYDEAVRLIESK